MRDAFRREGRRRSNHVMSTQATLRTFSQELLCVKFPELLAPTSLGKRTQKVLVLHQIAQPVFIFSSLCGKLSVFVELFFAAREYSNALVENHVARPAIPRAHVFQFAVRRKNCAIRNAADVLDDAMCTRVPQQTPIGVRHERGTLPARCNVGYPEIRNRGDARALGYDCAFADLQSRAALRQMTYRVTVRGNAIEVLRRQLASLDEF